MKRYALVRGLAAQQNDETLGATSERTGVYTLVDLTRWAERLYSETDIPRSLATSISALVGLAVYLRVDDWVIAAFTLVIAFPLVRVVVAGVHSFLDRRLEGQRTQTALRRQLDRLSPEEREVVATFVRAGGRVITWSQANSLELGGSAFESLMSRGLIATSVTADSFRETFVLDEELFDAARRLQGRPK